MSKTTIYGIPNCDTVKKARKWLDGQSIEYHFHDFRKDGLDEGKVNAWLNTIEASKLLNKRSTTWKQLPESQKDQLNDDNLAALLVESPTLIKRPVLEINGRAVSVGFSEKEYQQLIG